MTTMTLPNESITQKAWVVFSGQADLPWLRMLRRGFRHCFVIIHDGSTWLSVDPMLHRMEVYAHHHLPKDFDLPCWLENRGQRVIPVDRGATPVRPAPWGFFTCVEAVKRVLGIHARFVVTPWQLYRYLNKNT